VPFRKNPVAQSAYIAKVATYTPPACHYERSEESRQFMQESKSSDPAQWGNAAVPTTFEFQISSSGFQIRRPGTQNSDLRLNS
jgi:hypothetical protein